MTPESLEPLATSPGEVRELMNRFSVALRDAQLVGQSPDGRYIDAYTAGFLLSKVVVRAAGLRVRGGESHLDTLRAIPWLMGSAARPLVDALDAARKRRKATMYDAAGLVEETDIADLLVRIIEFKQMVDVWLDENHPELQSE